MAKKELIGHVPCGCCTFEDAEVRTDKNGNPYVYCPDCNAQLLTHGRAERVKPLLARMRPAASPKPAMPDPAPATIAGNGERLLPGQHEPVWPGQKARPEKPAAPAASPDPQPAESKEKPAPAKKAGVFSTLLD